MCVVLGGHFWQLGSIASLATESTILVVFVPNMALEAISQCLIVKIFLGEHPPTPHSLFTLTRTQWPYHSKIVGAGPDMRFCDHKTFCTTAAQEMDTQVENQNFTLVRKVLQIN